MKFKRLLATVTLPTYQGTAFKYGTATTSLGTIIGDALKYVYVIAGFGLLVMLVWGGVTLMTAGGDQNKTREGYGKITASLIGFGIIFVSYFVAQVVQIVFNVKFLG